MADASYPDDLLYHPEHDWVRLDGDVATFGITWFAQDALGELVHYEPPEEGAEIAKGSSYGEGWLVRIRLSDASEADDLMNAAAYKSFVDEQ